MHEPSGQQPQPLVRTYMYVLAALTGLVGGIGVWLGTELWHLAVGAPLLLVAAALVRYARRDG